MKQADIDKLITQALRSRPEAEREDDIQQILRQDEREAWSLTPTAAGVATTGSRRQKVWMKAAAMFVGVLFVSALSFAAIHLANLIPSPSPKDRGVYSSAPDNSIDKGDHSPLLGRGAGGEASPIIFDNVPLGEMLPEIARHYGLTVQFQNEKVRDLRFYFKWNPAAPVSKVVEELNMFEQVNLKLNDQTIIAE